MTMYWACGIFTELVNLENPILADLLERLLGGMSLCAVSTVIWFSARHLSIKKLPQRKPQTSQSRQDGWSSVLYHNLEIDELVECTGPFT